MTTSGLATGLQVVGGAAGLAAPFVRNRQGRQDRNVARGGEDPSVAALRQRLAAQNAQTAMAVAASQQGVNPALAQRNAQQALAQQQVATNANLAQVNTQFAQQAQAQERGRQQQIQAAILGGAEGLSAAGAQISADNAAQEAVTPQVPTLANPAAAPAGPEQAAFQNQILAPTQEGAAGLTAPPASGAVVPVPTPAAQQPAEVAPVPGSAADFIQQASMVQEQEPAGQLQMQGGQSQLTQAPQASFQPSQLQVASTAPIQEAPVQAAPQPTSTPAAAQVAAPAPQSQALPARTAIAALPPEVLNDPANAATISSADILEENGMAEQADAVRMAFLRSLTNAG